MMRLAQYAAVGAVAGTVANVHIGQGNILGGLLLCAIIAMAGWSALDNLKEK